VGFLCTRSPNLLSLFVSESAPACSSAPPLSPTAIGRLQVAGWVVYGIVYYLILRPHQPFADLLWKQPLIATGSGLLLSTALGALYWAVGLLRQSPLWQGLTTFAGSLAVGLLWYQGKEWGADWVDPFIAPVTGITALRPGEGSILSALPAFPIVMLAWSGLYLGLAQWYQQQKQERRLLRADAEAQRAQLRMLRYQLNPHFFFNALNTIGALADENPQRVKTAVRELSGFLHYTLLDEGALDAPLRDEVAAAGRGPSKTATRRARSVPTSRRTPGRILLPLQTTTNRSMGLLHGPGGASSRTTALRVLHRPGQGAWLFQSGLVGLLLADL